MINPTKQAIEAVGTAAVLEEVGEAVTLESLAYGHELRQADAIDESPKQATSAADANAHLLALGVQVSCVGQHGRYRVSIDGRSFEIKDIHFHGLVSSLLQYALKYYTKKTPEEAKERLAELRNELAAKAKK